jgi:hypothetical protein
MEYVRSTPRASSCPLCAFHKASSPRTANHTGFRHTARLLRVSDLWLRATHFHVLRRQRAVAGLLVSAHAEESPQAQPDSPGSLRPYPRLVPSAPRDAALREGLAPHFAHDRRLQGKSQLAATRIDALRRARKALILAEQRGAVLKVLVAESSNSVPQSQSASNLPILLLYVAGRNRPILPAPTSFPGPATHHDQSSESASPSSRRPSPHNASSTPPTASSVSLHCTHHPTDPTP